MVNRLLIGFLIVIILSNCRAQICTRLAETDQYINCSVLSKVLTYSKEKKCDHHILFQDDQDDSSYCREVVNSGYSSGRIEVQCNNTTSGNIICASIPIKFECTSCQRKETCTENDESDCIETCNCNCQVKCTRIQNGDFVANIITLVSKETILQTLAATTASTNPTHSITTHSTDPNTATNAPTRRPQQHSTQTANTTTVSISMQVPTRLPFTIPRIVLYGVPGAFVLLIALTTLIVLSLLMCTWCRGMRKKLQDPEAITMNEQLVVGNIMTREPIYESTYSTISELVPTNDLTEINRVTPNRSTYIECLEAEQSLNEVSSPEQIIQNELYNVGNTNESEIESRVGCQRENPNNFYHVLVAGEVVEPSIYDRITETNPLYFCSKAGDLHLANSITAMRDTYIEPPNSLPELKSMLDTCMHEINAGDIEIGEEFASGQFGLVYRGNYHTEKGDIPVAIKTLKETAVANTDTKVAFMREAAILAQFHHPNVLRLIGILTTTHQPWMMVTELLKTELRQLLLQIKLAPAVPSSPDKFLTQNLLLKFSQEVAAGMEHLAEKKFIHRDLAARNVLVAKDLSVRVADFGMSRGIDNENDYYTSSGGRVPLRWTAPEAVFYKKFSEKSDVWSFGMTLFEIWSLGDKPWQGCNNEEVMQAISTDRTLSQPVNCPTQVYQVMLDTWKQEKDSRPSFTQLKKELKRITLN